MTPEERIKVLEDAIRDVHDDIMTSHPAAYWFDKDQPRPTTREDYDAFFRRIDDKLTKALYGD